MPSLSTFLPCFSLPKVAGETACYKQHKILCNFETIFSNVSIILRITNLDVFFLLSVGTSLNIPFHLNLCHAFFFLRGKKSNSSG
jgi:hypothetical protein